MEAFAASSLAPAPTWLAHAPVPIPAPVPRRDRDHGGIGTALAPPDDYEPAPHPGTTVRTLFIQFSGLIGALTFANRLFGDAGPQNAALASFAAAASIYAVLALGDFLIRRGLDFADRRRQTERREADAANDAPAAPIESPSAIAA